MKLRIYSFENEIDFDVNCITTISIEDVGCFSRIVSLLYSYKSGEYADEQISLEIDNKKVDIDKNVEIVLDMFAYSVNQKKMINYLNAYVEGQIAFDEEKKTEIEKNIQLIRLEVEDIISELPFNTCYKDKISIDEVIKMFSLTYEEVPKINNKEKILQIISTLAFTKQYKLLVIVNARRFFDDEDILEICKHSMYNDIKVLFLEQGLVTNPNEYEHLIVVDKEFEEYIV